MNVFITYETLEARYGLETLKLSAGVDENGTLLMDRVTRAISTANSKVNGYVCKRYPAALPAVPEFLVDHACTIALYSLSLEYGQGLTDEKTTRYKNAISELRDVASGLVSLGLEPENTPKRDDMTPLIVSAPGRYSGRGRR